jgi:hypothetical protein
MSDYTPFKEIRTKVVGVTMGLDADTRQLAIRTIGENLETRVRWFLDLVPEPTNEYDRDALQVMSDVPGMGRVQLGYVSNCEITCGFCGKGFPKWPMEKGKKIDLCPTCGSTELKRDGLASMMCRVMRQDPAANFYGEVLSVTGGTDDKPSCGLNFAIRKAFPKKKDS